MWKHLFASAAAVAVTLTAVAVGASPAGLVRGDPETLVVQAGDLPATFAIARGARQAGSYVALYFRPEVLAATELPQGDLMGVTASVEVMNDAAAAAESFAAVGSAESIRESLGGAGAGGELESVQGVDTELAGADQAQLFRVEYTLQGVHVVDYRYRVRVANAMASLMVSGRAGAGGSEPAALAEQARGVAERQVARLAAARE